MQASELLTHRLGLHYAGKPIFPGASTINQLECIIELIGPPTQEDLTDGIESPYAVTMLQSLAPSKAAQLPAEERWLSKFPNASPNALDLIKKLLVFNPKKRLTAKQALEHPYVAAFHNEAAETEAHGPVSNQAKYMYARHRKVD